MAVTEYLRSNWHLFTLAVIAACGVGAAIFLFSTMPPNSIAMATGPEGGAYYEIGKQYQSVLARAGVELRLVATAGSVENLSLMSDLESGVDIALVQSGLIHKPASDVASLGTLFYEPLWIFYRGKLTGETLAALRGHKVSIGPVGSGSYALMMQLLKRNTIDQQVAELLTLSPREAVDKLLAGEIDVAALLASWDAPVIQQLISDDRVRLFGIVRADAYIALYPFLSKLILPRGAGDLANDLPPIDTTLLATKASLMVREDLHPALQYLLLNAAMQIHSGNGVFQRVGRFPAAEGIELPLSREAIRFYKSGPPFLHDNLPFWMASLVGRFLILLIPIFAVMYPLVRFLPALYGWLMRRRIARLYGELRFLEDEITSGKSTAQTAQLRLRLDHLQTQANQLRMPIAYQAMIFLLRNHIEIVRSHLARPT